MELKPTDTITISVSDFETKYVSREAYDALCAELAALKDQIHDLVHDKLALKAANEWYPASEPPETEDKVQIVCTARYIKNTLPLGKKLVINQTTNYVPTRSWRIYDITAWRFFPPEGEA
jgi:hypothetical protein